MTLGNVGHSNSTFALQVMSVASQVNASSICAAIAGMAQALTNMHGEAWAASMRAGHTSAQEWNMWANMNGCVGPWPGAGQSSHADISVIDAAVKAAIGASNNPMQPALPNQPSPSPLPNQPIPGNRQNLLGLPSDPTAWTKMPSSDRPGDVLRAAQASKPSIQNVAQINRTGTARAVAQWQAGARWGGYWDGQWQVEWDWAPDFNLGADGVNCSMAANQTGCAGTGGGGGNGKVMVYTGNDLVSDALGPGEEPTIVQTRRCKGRKRLAINGRCYDKSVIPAKWRANKERRAVISYSEGQQIVKGFRAAERIDKLAKRTGQKARKIAPKPRPRRRRIPSRTTRGNAAGPARIVNIDND